jgi:flagellar motility protein MotE (MotC chaperone)
MGTIIETDILDRTQEYVEHQLVKEEAAQAAGFDLQHTKALVKVAGEIGISCSLTKEEMELLLLSAWLYDLSYAQAGKAKGDEKYLKVAEFLESTGLSQAEASKILQCIAAARFPQHPQDTLEEALCDAVASFLAADDYLTQAEKQAQAEPGETQDRYEWMNGQRELFKKHAFFTKYGKRNFLAKKEENQKSLKKKQKELSKENPELEALWEENKKLKKDLVKQKEQKVSKGIETMFRTTMASHLQLSVMADSKANLMISINAIIASIMISSFIRNFEEVPHLIIPSVLLTLVCVFTIVFAVLSTRPNIKKTGIPDEKLDFLFFGDFVKLNSETYRDGIRGIMRDPDQLYNSMIDNIYLQGKVLAKKYRLLKLSYTVFMVGFGVVLLSYAIAWIFFEH